MFITLKDKPLSEFETVLNETCNRLQHTKAQFTIRRLRELIEILINLERELEKLVSSN